MSRSGAGKIGYAKYQHITVQSRKSNQIKIDLGK